MCAEQRSKQRQASNSNIRIFKKNRQKLVIRMERALASPKKVADTFEF